jgi:hypothetical protein
VEHGGAVIPSRPNSRAVFLNIPYDEQFGDLYVAYIAALAAHGMSPSATLELPGGARRLDRIIELIGGCRYSFHDLSRVELDTAEPPTPRLNMSFELGRISLSGCEAFDRIIARGPSKKPQTGTH